jgi:hypothetical protein
MAATHHSEAVPSLAEEAMLADALLGGGLPEAAERHLHQAALAYQNDEAAERHLREAQALAPGHAAVLIGFYRFYFYKGRLTDALGVARICLEKAARDNQIAPDWRRVAPADADFGSYEAVLPRFYLFTLKAYAYLRMRLGDLGEGRAAARKLLDLDPTDKIGARVLLGVLDRMECGDDE